MNAASSIIDSVLTNTVEAQAEANIPAKQFIVDASAVDDKNKAHERLMAMIDESGTKRAMAVVEKVMHEVPQDNIARARAFHFGVDGERVTLGLGENASRQLHNHALGQTAAVASMPMQWVNYLLAAKNGDEWGKNLLSHSLNECFAHSDKKHLVRSVGAQVRAVLSDTYRRLDSRPIMEALFGAFQQVGLRPFEGYALDTKIEVQAVIPRIYSPYPGELIVVGLTFRTSDYGDGALDVKSFMLRPACANGMIRESLLRQVHLGKRLSEDMGLSQATYDLDTKTMASATKDIVHNAFNGERIERELSAIRDAHNTVVDPTKIEARLRKMLTKAESEEVIKLFASADVVTLPAGGSAYRMSNAISWIANQTADEHRRIELQEVAGTFITEAVKAAA